jgi:peptide/nickel transport system permease protein
MMVAKRFFRSKLSVVGLVILIALFVFSFLGPVFSPWAENGQPVKDTENLQEIVLPVRIDFIDENGNKVTAYDITVEMPDWNKRGDISAQHWLGTDDAGYDLFTNLMLGGRISLTIGFIVILLETIIGVILGGLAGYFGGWVDQVIMRVVDILSCIPSLPIMLILSATLTANGILDIRRLYYLMIVLTLFGWVGTARLVRGQILSLREQEFMLAAKCSGLATSKKIFRHLLPNVMPQLIVSMTMGLGSIILMEATLGFLGLGAPLGTPTWGAMISSAAKLEYLSGYPNFWIPPGICITLAILAFNFVGDGLRDAFDPKMKR